MYRSGLVTMLMRLFADGITEEKTLAEVAQILGDFITDSMLPFYFFVLSACCR